MQEFSGDWILSSSSVEDIGINTGPGIASAVLRHITLDRKGNGTENNGTFLFYLPDGTFNKYLGVNTELIKLRLTDPVNGAGTLAVTDTSTFQAYPSRRENATSWASSK